MVFLNIVDKGRAGRSDIGFRFVPFCNAPGAIRDLISPLRRLSYISESQSSERRGQAGPLPFVENSGKGRGNAHCDKGAAVDEPLGHIDIMTERLGLLRTLADTGAAGNAAFFIDICLSFLHADCLDGAISEAPVTIPAAGRKRKNNLVKMCISHMSSFP